MMASVTFKVQGSFSTLSSGPSSSSWSKGNKVKHLTLLPNAIKKKDRFVSLRCNSCLSIGALPVLGPKSKSFKISAFKGSIRRNDAGGRTNGSKSLENPLNVSYLQHQNEDSSVESSKVRNAAPCTSNDEMTPRSLAIQKLFKSWLMLLRAPPVPLPADEVREEHSLTETSAEPKSVQIKKESHVPLKSVWGYFLGLDAAITLPFLIFAPLYLAVNLLYGAEVSKELGPLWILGPVYVALYIKTFRAVCAAYVFSFKQTVRLIKNAPAYYMLVLDRIATLRNNIWQPWEDFKSMNRSVVARKLIMDLIDWLGDKYLDLVEMIWPFYCRTIRFLKRANFI